MKRIDYIEQIEKEYTRKELLNGYCSGNFNNSFPKRLQGINEKECQDENGYKSCKECWNDNIDITKVNQ